MNVLISPPVRDLDGRGIDRATRERLAVLQRCRLRHSVDSPGLLILGPGAAGDIPADDTLEWKHGVFSDYHRTTSQTCLLVRGTGSSGESQVDDVVLDVGKVGWEDFGDPVVG